MPLRPEPLGSSPAVASSSVAWGMRQGAFFAAGFTLLATVGWLIGGPTLRSSLADHAAGVLAIHWGTGLAAGALVGLLRRRLHRRRVALLVGALIGTAFMLEFVLWSLGWRGLAAPGAWAIAAAAGAPLGSATAWSFWRSEQRRVVRSPHE